MAITKIGTKLISNGAITTVKLGSSAVTRADIQSGSVQVTHIDVNQGSDGHVDFIDTDFFIAGDATNNNARGFSFSQLKTALSLSNAARGEEGTVQFNNGSGFDGISKITTDGIHLTASDGAKIVLAYTGISGSTGEISATGKKALTIFGKNEILLHSSGTVQGNQSASFGISSAGLIPAIKPAVTASPGTFRLQFTSGSIGNESSGVPKTYGPIKQYYAQHIVVTSTGSTPVIHDFYFDNAAGNAPLPVSASINLEFSSYSIAKLRHDVPVQVITGVTDWRNVVTNLYNAMDAELPTSLASVSLNSTSSINGTASIDVIFNSSAGIQGGVQIGTGVQSQFSQGRGTVFGTTANIGSPSNNPSPIEGQHQQANHGNKRSGEPDTSGGEVIARVSGSAAIDEDRTWFSLGASNYLYNNARTVNVSGSGQSIQIHKIDSDDGAFNLLKKSNFSSRPLFLSASATSTLHKIDVDEATIGKVILNNVRDSAAFAITGSETAKFHKIDADLGTIDRVSSLVVSGSKTTTIHKVDVDLGTIDRLSSLVVTGSGTSLFHKLTVDEGTHRRVVATALSGSGLVEFHNLTGGDVSGSIGEFHKVTADIVDARKIISEVTTKENLEIDVNQLIPAVSQSAGAAQEGAGLQIGGTAGTGSAGIASLVLGDAGSGAGADLLLKIGTVQGASLLSGTGGVRLGVTGSLSASVGVFHEVTVNQDMGAQDSIFSGSSFTGHLLSGSSALGHFLNVDRAEVADVSGSSLTYHTITGSEVNAHRVRGDVVLIADVSGSTAKYHTLSGSTITANLADLDRSTAGDVDVAGAISGSGTSTLHKVTSDNVSGSHITAHELGSGPNYADFADSVTVRSISGNDIIKKAHLTQEIVRANNNAHGGLTYNNGQLSVGWKRRIFSRSSKKLLNRSQPTQGSGSLFTTCSLGETRMVSGSEMVYFNGLLLTKGNDAQGNPNDGDYNIDYNGGGGLQPGVYRMVFTSGSTGPEEGSGVPKTYGPLKQYYAQTFVVESTGSEFYVFYFNEAANPSPLPVSASINLNFSTETKLSNGQGRYDIAVEAVSGVTDWRDVVSNLATAMNTALNTQADLATVSYNATASINGTASIEIAYKAGTIEGDIQIGAGTFVHNNNNGMISTTRATQYFSPSDQPAPIESYTSAFGSHNNKRDGEPDRSGARAQFVTTGSTLQPGTEIFLSENLAMDSDDVLVVQYLSGTAPVG